MTIRGHLTATLGATHLFMLDDATRDPGSTGIDTSLVLDNASFQPVPISEGVSNSLQSLTINDFTTRQYGAIVGNTNDINTQSGICRQRCLYMWFRCSLIDSPSCIYEQGGGVNNFAFHVGMAKSITAQAAVVNQPFLICQSQFQVKENRSYFIASIWQYHAEHSGNGNRLLLYVNGVFQEEAQFDGQNVYPVHLGNISIGNSREALKTYNEGTINSSTREKNLNMLGMHNDNPTYFDPDTVAAGTLRDIFERTVRPMVTIAGDTVASQQAALDALVMTAYAGVNLAIRIIQATDATDYRLILDNITFEQDPTLRDIAVQYVGPNLLTLENANGSNAVEISAPPEIDLDGVTVLPGGGAIALSNNNLRAATPGTVTGIGNKLIITTPGTYILDGTDVSTVENDSGGPVTLQLLNGATVPTTFIETSGLFASLIFQPFTLTLEGIEPGSSVLFANQTKTPLQHLTNQSGTVSYTASVGYEGDLFYVVSKAGFTKITGSVTIVDQAGSTVAIAQKERFDTDGSQMYGGGLTSAFLSYSYAAPRITANLSADISARTFYDQFQLFMESLEGCLWLIDHDDLTRMKGNSGKQMLIYSDGLNLNNSSLAGTLILQSEVISQENPLDVSIMGSVQTQTIFVIQQPNILI